LLPYLLSVDYICICNFVSVHAPVHVCPYVSVACVSLGNVDSLVWRWGSWLCTEFSRQSWLWWDLGENLPGTITVCI